MARRSTFFLLFLTLGAVAVTGMCLQGFARPTVLSPGQARNREAVKAFGLTDLCLFTEARYMRHLSQADLHSAFQDHPVALEHFPSGSFGGYGTAKKRDYGTVD